MKISIVAAMDQERGIGKDNKIPWKIKEDLVHLKNLTIGHTVILGRITYESMASYYTKSGRPMPGKLYIVITRDKNYKPARENATIAHSLEESLSFARGGLAKLEATSAQGFGEPKEVFVIGGAQIFQQAIDVADKLYLTIVDGKFDADAFFPDYSEFKKVVFEEEHDNGKYKFKFLELEK